MNCIWWFSCGSRNDQGCQFWHEEIKPVVRYYFYVNIVSCINKNIKSIINIYKFNLQTRKHSSRMRTVRYSDRGAGVCPGDVSARGGRVSAWGQWTGADTSRRQNDRRLRKNRKWMEFQLVPTQTKQEGLSVYSQSTACQQLLMSKWGWWEGFEQIWTSTGVGGPCELSHGDPLWLNRQNHTD